MSPRRENTCQVVAIGASTGGTVAIERIVRALPAGFPALLIAQHMPPYITRAFSQRLAQLADIEVEEAEDGCVLRQGLALVAPGGKHLVVERNGGELRVIVREGPRVNGHRPSVDVLFRSVADAVGARAIGVLLTGMGRDGAQGLLSMRAAGAHTLAQDEASSAVFGMPKVAIELGAAQEVLALGDMAARLRRAVKAA